MFFFLFIQNNMLNLTDVKFLSLFDRYAVNSVYIYTDKGKICPAEILQTAVVIRQFC